MTDRILDRVTEECADPRVTGAFARPRIGQTPIGGVTHRVMQRMTVPAFVSV